SLKDAFREHPDLVAPWYSKRLTVDRHKLEAANAAFWSAGAFLYVPPEVVVSDPFEVVYAIDARGIAQYGRTLVLGGQASEFRLHEYDLGEDFEGQALHAGAVEVYLQDGARCRFAQVQDWPAGEVHWRGAATGQSRASFEGLIQINPGAQRTHTYLQIHSMMLSPKARVDAIPSVLVSADDVSASHGGTVGELDEAAIFYMQSRGLDRPAAVRVIVEGFFEPLIAELEDEPLEELVRGKIERKLAAAREDIEAYATSR